MATATERKAERLTNTLKLIIAFEQGSKTASLEDFETNLEKLTDTYGEFKTLFDDPSFNLSATKFEECEKIYLLLKPKLVSGIKKLTKPDDRVNNQLLQSTVTDLMTSQMEFFKRFNPSSRDGPSRDASSSQQNQTMEIKLPRLNIEPFSGNYLDWPSFQNMFEAAVHNNTLLSRSHKFQLLKGLLRGEAAQLLSHIDVTDANYSQAWDKLKLRYYKKKPIIAALVQRFLDQSPITHLSGKNIRSIADVTDEVLRGIKVIGEEYESRDPWLVFILLSKLDNETRRLWAVETSEDDVISTSRLVDFLNKRASSLEGTEFISYSNSKPLARSQVKTFHTEENEQFRSCPICNESHSLFRCTKFSNLAPAEKRKTVINLKVCFNCLKPYHSVLNCQSRFSCRICRRRHHTLLHNQIPSDDNRGVNENNPNNNNEPSPVLNSDLQNESNPAQPRTFTISSVASQYPNKLSSQPTEINDHSTIPSPNIPSIEEETSINISNKPASTSLQSTKTSSINEVSNVLPNKTNFNTCTAGNYHHTFATYPSATPYQSHSVSRNFSQQYLFQSLLPTAIVQVLDHAGQTHACRSLLDSGSQFSFITEQCADQLKLTKHYSSLTVKGLALMKSEATKGQVDLKFKAPKTMS